MMSKKIIGICAAFMVAATLKVNSSAYNYYFYIGEYQFGNKTSTDYPVSKAEPQLNVRRNKDVTDFPPSYGVFSGNFDTEVTNPYVKKQYEEENFSDWVSGVSGTSTNFSSSTSGDFWSSTSMLAEIEPTSFSISYLSSINISQNVITDVSYLADGSIGTLKAPNFAKSIKVYEDTTVENMRKGLGHATYTSGWDGVIGLFGHNRGDYAHFSFLKDLEKGDKLSYTTTYGTRNYAVSGIYKINATDTSHLNWSSENQLVMITCIANEPNYRLCVVVSEIIS